MTTGMIEVNGLHYYMDPSTGRMAAGQTLEIGGAVYEAAADGHLIPQGQEESGSTNQESASDSAGTASGSSGTSSNPHYYPVKPEAETALPPKTFQSPQLLLQESTAAPVSALLPPRGR